MLIFLPIIYILIYYSKTKNASYTNKIKSLWEKKSRYEDLFTSAYGSGFLVWSKLKEELLPPKEMYATEGDAQ